MAIDEHDSVILQVGVTRRRECEAIAEGVRFVWSRDDIESEREVAGRSRHRPDDREVGPPGKRTHARRRVSALWHEFVCRLMCENAAIVGRGTQRTSEVRS